MLKYTPNNIVERLTTLKQLICYHLEQESCTVHNIQRDVPTLPVSQRTLFSAHLSLIRKDIEYNNTLLAAPNTRTPEDPVFPLCKTKLPLILCEAQNVLIAQRRHTTDESTYQDLSSTIATLTIFLEQLIELETLGSIDKPKASKSVGFALGTKP